ncbi:bactofilin family protein [Pseudoalteromonas sp. T1lg65]|uniref:bactofilin family protein n=1 Tax=Pseudoalteromonas sp. T1lg65 TaxID=2077101 RepID=UPI003F7AE370
MFSPFKSSKQTIPALISPNTQITGDIDCDGELQLDGVVEGNLRVAQLTIGKQGSVKGNISSQQLIVLGKVEGDIQAKHVTLAESAEVIGDIKHETLVIEAGASVDGKFTHTDDSDKGASNVTPIEQQSS